MDVYAMWFGYSLAAFFFAYGFTLLFIAAAMKFAQLLGLAAEMIEALKIVWSRKLAKRKGR